MPDNDAAFAKKRELRIVENAAVILETASSVEPPTGPSAVPLSSKAPPITLRRLADLYAVGQTASGAYDPAKFNTPP
jgi:hypothetical protein